MARGAVVFPAQETDPEQYYTKAEVDAKIEYLAALNTNAARLVYTNQALVSKNSGWSVTLPDSVDYVRYGSTNLVRGGSTRTYRYLYFNDGTTTVTGTSTVTFAANGILSASRFVLSGGASYQQDQFGSDSSSYDVQGYHYITLKDFEG